MNIDIESILFKIKILIIFIMCLFIPIFKRAEKPIKVYKVLESSKKSPCYPYSWICNEIRMTPLTDIRKGIKITYSDTHPVTISMSYGFHSYSKNIPSIQALYESYRSFHRKIFEAIIPAGAYYAEGMNGKIISNKLIITSYFYKPVKIFGKTFFIRKKDKT